MDNLEIADSVLPSQASHNLMYPQQYFTASNTPTAPKATMKHKAIATGTTRSLEKAKIYGGPTALIKNLKAHRPLNSWMAYRSYYSKIFVNLQQKDISSILQMLWHKDPFHAKWTILAKAFSVIRDDKGKKDASLEPFLTINGPLVQVIPHEIYLRVMGYRIIMTTGQQNDDGRLSLRQNPDWRLDRVKQFIKTNVSVDDVVENCYCHGFIIEDNRRTLPVTIENQGSLIMATTTVAPHFPSSPIATAVSRCSASSFTSIAETRGPMQQEAAAAAATENHTTTQLRDFQKKTEKKKNLGGGGGHGQKKEKKEEKKEKKEEKKKKKEEKKKKEKKEEKKKKKEKKKKTAIVVVDDDDDDDDDTDDDNQAVVSIFGGGGQQQQQQQQQQKKSCSEETGDDVAARTTTIPTTTTPQTTTIPSSTAVVSLGNQVAAAVNASFFDDYPHNSAFEPPTTTNTGESSSSSYYFDPFGGGGYPFDAVDMMEDLDNNSFNLNDWIDGDMLFN